MSASTTRGRCRPTRRATFRFRAWARRRSTLPLDDRRAAATFERAVSRARRRARSAISSAGRGRRAASYRRGLEYVPGLATPVYADGFHGRRRWPAERRLGRSGVGGLFGWRVRAVATRRRRSTPTPRMSGLRYALSRTLGRCTREYLYYYYDFRGTAQLPPGVAARARAKRRPRRPDALGSRDEKVSSCCQERSTRAEEILRILLRRRWLLVAARGARAGRLVWSRSSVLPEQYRSETLILVVPQRIPDRSRCHERQRHGRRPPEHHQRSDPEPLAPRADHSATSICTATARATASWRMSSSACAHDIKVEGRREGVVSRQLRERHGRRRLRRSPSGWRRSTSKRTSATRRTWPRAPTSFSSRSSKTPSGG